MPKVYVELDNLSKEELIQLLLNKEEEMETLKTIIVNNDLEQKADWKHIEELEQENKKLKKEIFVMKDRLKFGYKGVTREEIERVEEENESLKDKIEFLTQCLDDRDKSIELMKGTVAQYMIDGETELQLNGNIETLLEENKNLKEENKWFNKKIKQAGKYVATTMKENQKLKEDFDNYKKKVSEDMKIIVKNQIENIKLFDKMKGEYKKLEEEHKRLKEVYDACNLDSINKAFRIANLEMENKKLKTLEIGGKTVEERIEIDKGVVRE